MKLTSRDMKRTIKFRGLRVDGKGWVYSTSIDFTSTGAVYLASHDEDGRFRWHEVKPETVCQFTGMKDSHGAEVFEHDLLELEFFSENRQVEFISSMFQINGIPLIKYAMSYRAVRGNIHETPAP